MKLAAIFQVTENMKELNLRPENFESVTMATVAAGSAVDPLGVNIS